MDSKPMNTPMKSQQDDEIRFNEHIIFLSSYIMGELPSWSHITYSRGLSLYFNFSVKKSSYFNFLVSNQSSNDVN